MDVTTVKCGNREGIVSLEVEIEIEIEIEI